MTAEEIYLRLRDELTADNESSSSPERIFIKADGQTVCTLGMNRSHEIIFVEFKPAPKDLGGIEREHFVHPHPVEMLHNAGWRQAQLTGWEEAEKLLEIIQRSYKKKTRGDEPARRRRKARVAVRGALVRKPKEEKKAAKEPPKRKVAAKKASPKAKVKPKVTPKTKAKAKAKPKAKARKAALKKVKAQPKKKAKAIPKAKKKVAAKSKSATKAKAKKKIAKKVVKKKAAKRTKTPARKTVKAKAKPAKKVKAKKVKPKKKKR